jgi:tetratricopeptide (TPR) repeat protein
MVKVGEPSQKIDGDSNTQIHSERDSVVAIGPHSIAAGGDIHMGMSREQEEKLTEILRLVSMNQSNSKDSLKHAVTFQELDKICSRYGLNVQQTLQDPSNWNQGNFDSDKSLTELTSKVSILVEGDLGLENQDAAKFMSTLLVMQALIDWPSLEKNKIYHSYSNNLLSLSELFADVEFNYMAKLFTCIFLFRQNDAEKSLLIAKEVLNQLPKNSSLYSEFTDLVAACNVSLGRLVEAEKSYLQLVENEGRFDKTYSLVATMVSQGKNHEAESLLNKFTKTDRFRDSLLPPRQIMYLRLLSSIYYNLKDYDKSDEILANLMKTKSDSIDEHEKMQILNIRGQNFLMRATLVCNSDKDYQESTLLIKAERFFMDSISIAKNITAGDDLDNPVHNLGMVFYFRGEYEKAQEMFEKATNPKAPLNALDSNSMKAVVQIKLGKKTSGRRLLLETIERAQNYNSMAKTGSYIHDFCFLFPGDKSLEKLITEYILTSVERKTIIVDCIDNLFPLLFDIYSSRGEQGKIDFWIRYREMHNF